MRLLVLWVGKDRGDHLDEAVRIYLRRCSARWRAEDIPVKPESRLKKADPAKAAVAETERLLKKVPPGYYVIAADREGEELTSEEFAELVAFVERTRQGLAVVIGGDHGLSKTKISRCDKILSLGKMTLGHKVARLVVWEQLYRALDIISGGPYHRPGRTS